MHQFIEMLFGDQSSKVRCAEQVKDEVRRLAGKPEAARKFGEVRRLFEEGDTDQDGFLDEVEMVAVAQRYYKVEGKARGKKHIQEEIAEALSRHPIRVRRVKP